MISRAASHFLAMMRHRFLLWRSPPEFFDRLLKLPFYRELLLEQFKHVQAPPKSRVLELGCGPGALGAILERGKFDLVGCDRSAQMLRFAERTRKGVYEDLVQGEGGQLPFEEGSFDGAFCANVFHLFKDPLAALEDLGRVLKPGAPLVLAGPEKGFSPEVAKQFTREENLGCEESAALLLWSRARTPLGSEAYQNLVTRSSFRERSVEWQMRKAMFSLRLERSNR